MSLKKEKTDAYASWMIAHPEKRHHRRLDVSLDVDLVIEGQKVSMTATNISCGGMFLQSNQQNPFLQGQERAQLTLSLPGTSRPVKVAGEFIRHQSQEGEGVAVRFAGLYDDNILEIDRFIKSRLH